MRDNQIHDNGVGMFLAPGNNTISSAVATLKNNTINDNTCGVSVGAFGSNASTPDANTNCGTAALGAINKPVSARLWGNGIYDNSFGVFVRGGNGSVKMGNNEVTDNFTFGLRSLESGVLRTTTPGTNILSNVADDPFNGTAIPVG